VRGKGYFSKHLAGGGRVKSFPGDENEAWVAQFSWQVGAAMVTERSRNAGAREVATKRMNNS
jgi:hypothetical protein